MQCYSVLFCNVALILSTCFSSVFVTLMLPIWIVFSLLFVPLTIWTSDLGTLRAWNNQSRNPGWQGRTSAMTALTALFASPSFARAATQSSTAWSETARMPSLCALAPGLTRQSSWSEAVGTLQPLAATKRMAGEDMTTGAYAKGTAPGVGRRLQLEMVGGRGRWLGDMPDVDSESNYQMQTRQAGNDARGRKQGCADRSRHGPARRRRQSHDQTRVGRASDPSGRVCCLRIHMRRSARRHARRA